MQDEIKLSPEEVDRVTQIIAQAYSDMEAVARGIGAHAQNVTLAYNGAGTATAQTTYEDLGRAGQALANALDGLSQDLNLTSQTGQQTDSDALRVLNMVDTGALGHISHGGPVGPTGGASGGMRVDLAIAQGI